jgi:hypothetical protein
MRSHRCLIRLLLLVIVLIFVGCSQSIPPPVEREDGLPTYPGGTTKLPPPRRLKNAKANQRGSQSPGRPAPTPRSGRD